MLFLSARRSKAVIQKHVIGYQSLVMIVDSELVAAAAAVVAAEAAAAAVAADLTYRSVDKECAEDGESEWKDDRSRARGSNLHAKNSQLEYRRGGVHGET